MLIVRRMLLGNKVAASAIAVGVAPVVATTAVVIVVIVVAAAAAASTVRSVHT
jgi:hypothetical protein